MSHRTDHMNKVYEEARKFLGPYFVGFDTLFQDAAATVSNFTGYPPYNIVRNDGETVIEVALAGLSTEDIQVYLEKNILHILHEKQEEVEGTEYAHRGIAARSFHLTFPVVQGVLVNSAKMKDGLLRVFMAKVTPPDPVKNFVAITTE